MKIKVKYLLEESDRKQIKQNMKKLGIRTFEELAAKIGCNKSTLSTYLSGRETCSERIYQSLKIIGVLEVEDEEIIIQRQQQNKKLDIERKLEKLEKLETIYKKLKEVFENNENEQPKNKRK